MDKTDSLPEKAAEASAKNAVISDAWDFKGRPAIRSDTGGWTSASMILGVELCERLTTLGIAVNLVTYLTDTMHIGNAAAANTVTNFLGTSFMLCLLGGFVADTLFGRYLTIVIFSAVQASGVSVLTISTVTAGLRPPPGERATGAQLGMLYLALYLTALGTGGLKSSVSGLGSDQFDGMDPVESKQMALFFNWFFFFISLGSLLAVTVLVYIQDNVGRDWGYGICAASIIAGLALFLAGTTRYRFKKRVGSPLTQIAAVFAASIWKRNLPLPPDPSLLHDIMNVSESGGGGGCSGGRSKKAKHRLPHTKQFRFLDRASIVDGGLPSTAVEKQSHWKQSTVTDVEEVKQVIRMLPIWATTIMFWTVYAQMTTFSVSQAAAMDRHLGPTFLIPAGSLTAFFVAGILLTVPIYDRLLIPLFRRLTGNPQGLTPLRRIGAGLFLSIVAMSAAALTEMSRLRTQHPSVFRLVPQFFLVGSGEALTYIGQLEFFLRECPEGMKTMSTGLFLTTLSLGCFLSSALVAVVHRVTGRSGRGAWLPDDLNQGRLYNFYWLLAVLSGINLMAFLVSANWYVYKERVPASEGDDGDNPASHA